MSSLPLAALAAPGGFVCDPRFSTAPLPMAEPDDATATAWHEGYVAGEAAAREDAEARAAADDAARAGIELALARLDAEQGEILRRRLIETVEALCGAALAPLAHDDGALLARIERAAAMLARADDQRVLRLHPDDLALVGKRLPADLPVEPDPALERGALRLESGTGGVEDGPGQWRRIIAEAVGQC